MKRKNQDVEYINNKKFINGFLCNDEGKPITVSNGYTQEDEDFASQVYEQEKRNKNNALEL